MNAFITLVSSQDYLLAALVLNQSLKATQSAYPLVVALTENLATDKNLQILQSEHIPVEIIKPLYYNQKTQNFVKQSQWNLSILNTASKINLFELNHYDKLVYLDADSLILTNVDELFNYPDGAMVWWHLEGKDRGMSGLFVFVPKNHNTAIYRTILQYNLCLDGNLLSDLFFPCLSNEDYRIPDVYMKNLPSNDTVKIVHFGGRQKKPFLMSTEQMQQYQQFNPIYQVYCRYAISLKQKYNI